MTPSTAASVGVATPVRMLPSTMIGITSTGSPTTVARIRSR